MDSGYKNLKKASVIVPVFNSESTLEELTNRLVCVLELLFNQFEILFVNDNSKDQSWSVIMMLSSKYSFVSGINLAKNYGQHNALLCGIRHAKYPVTITLDDDLQNLPEDIPSLLNKFLEGYDLVYGKPIKRRHGLLRNTASTVIKIIFKYVFKLKHASYISTFRIFKTHLRGQFAQFSSHQVSIDVLLGWTTDKIGVVVTQDKKRKIGISNYGYLKLIQYAVNIIFNSSTFPLKIASYIGLCISAFSFILLIYILMRYFFVGFIVHGFAFLAIIISLFSGVQLFTLGILGEYLGRVYFTLLKKPQYTINERYDG